MKLVSDKANFFILTSDLWSLASGLSGLDMRGKRLRDVAGARGAFRGGRAWRRRAAGLLFLCYCAAVYCAPDTLRQPLNEQEVEPAYKVFYENGFYREAIELLRMKLLDRSDTVKIDYFTYLAFCYAAGGWRDSAITVFHKILEYDSAFHLDTIATSPKILEVFVEAAARRPAARHVSAAPASRRADTVIVPAVAFVPKKTAFPEATEAPKPDMGRFLEPRMPEEKPASASVGWERYVMYCMPGGAGQFVRGRTIRGSVLLGMEVAGLTAGAWAYFKWRESFDHDYGWTEANKDPYKKYSMCSIGGFGIFLSAYSISVIESFIGNWTDNR